MDHPTDRPPLSPHPVLANHYGTAEERVGYIRRLFDRTAADYDRINDWMSLNRGESYRREAMIRAGVQPGQSVLDCACGTGVMAAQAQALVGDAGQVIALDPSLPMLAIAKARGVRLRMAGIAEQLALPDRSLDVIAMGYALRHVADLGVTFAEFARVLRPGGRLLILEMVPPTSRIGYGLTRFYLKSLVPTLASWVGRSPDARQLMRYYWDTVDRCVAPEIVIEALREAGFQGVTRSVQFALLTEYTASRPDA
ncbi:class I SAM-dependent methyltransferase [Thiocystis violascens]|uniref:Methylase involved in ubiquinone/menaquinone biosynthesis n=1 Tax=Thiocystis violascens (strain ATCC 17096 / DSM 198 / 6111) TaxID=765911 RepID=I3YB27_THIV6|nr:class I SAM-dependent methyltransferase [Thiocystis violascens]AFL74195.1 methylase involved in ubiquinone/menaquinone biosynthesis [Thiocystis violascens DSM 198]